MFQYASIFMNQHFDTLLPTSSRVFNVSIFLDVTLPYLSIFQLRHIPFFTWFVFRCTSFS
jgi:hypothetical protein